MMRAIALAALIVGAQVPGAQAAITLRPCTSGAPSCALAGVRKLEALFEPQAASCDHNAVFTLAYVRTTQTFAWARDQPGYLADPAWLNQEDAAFEGYFFTAVDNDAAGRAGVPPAWQIAFAAAKNHQVTALGDALLGMNAHINADLPFVLASIGLSGPGGVSHEADQEKFNSVLGATIGPLLDEIGARFDPTVTEYGSLGTAGALALIAGWRDMAWDNAELLLAAPSPAAQALVAQAIQTEAAAEAAVIVAGTSYLPILQSSAARDAFCAVHHSDPPPTPYAFGTAAP